MDKARPVISFRPLIGVIISNTPLPTMPQRHGRVSVPLSGLSFLMENISMFSKVANMVSVPLSGLSFLIPSQASVDGFMNMFPSPYRGYHF